MLYEWHHQNLPLSRFESFCGLYHTVLGPIWISRSCDRMRFVMHPQNMLFLHFWVYFVRYSILFSGPKMICRSRDPMYAICDASSKPIVLWGIARYFEALGRFLGLVTLGKLFELHREYLPLSRFWVVLWVIAHCSGPMTISRSHDTKYVI